MTSVIINDILPLTQAIATGGQTVFSTDWTADVASDVVVYQRAANTSADDATQKLSPTAYNVSFVGIDLIVQVTLVSGATAGDVVTITRQTPADRLNLYTNTNFTPSMLNNDFGILTLVDQQAQLVNQQVAPRYNYSAFIDVPVDTILPILLPNQTWAKNSANTSIVGITIPASGAAPADGTYVLLTSDLSELPNSFGLDTVAAGIMINDPAGPSIISRQITGTSEQITITNPTGIAGDINVAIATNPVIPGTAGMGVPEGTTAERVVPITGINFRYNTTLGELEFYAGGMWNQLPDSSDFSDLANLKFILQQPSGFTPNAQALSALSTGILKSTTITGVVSISAPLTSIDALTTVANDLLYLTAPNTYGVLAPSNSSVLASSATGVPTWLGPLTDGQLIIGSTGAIPVAGSLAAGSGVTITPGPGTITISATGTGGTVTSISAGSGIALTPDPIVTTGSIALAPIADHTLLANISGGALAPSSTTLTALIDNAIGSTRGDILYRNATVWTVLAPGTVGFSLQTGGAGADPSYSNTFTNSSLVTPTTLGVQQQALNMNSHLINNVTDPVSAQDAATMAYVLSVAQGRIFKDPCVAATTANFSATYSNGSSGIGATLTGTVMAAFAPDGVTLAVGDRVLFKDQTSSLQNGIYTTTVLGTGAVLPVFTRALDMDQPTEFKGATTFLIGGSTQAGQTYTETATVTSVGVDAVTFSLTGDATAVTSITAGSGITLSPSTITSTGSVSVTPGQIPGTTTNDNATAGNVGEVISSSITIGSAITLTDNTTANVTSISLTAGDWDVFGNVLFTGDISAVTTLTSCGISQTSATLPAAAFRAPLVPVANSYQNNSQGMVVPPQRLSLSGTTTVYLTALSNFSSGTMFASGNIFGRRRR